MVVAGCIWCMVYGALDSERTTGEGRRKEKGEKKIIIHDTTNNWACAFGNRTTLREVTRKGKKATRGRYE